MKIKYFYTICIVLILIGLFKSLEFTIQTKNLPWFKAQLCIDGESYVKGMYSIVKNSDFLNLEDIYHSPGFQMYIGLIYNVFKNENMIFQIIKFISWMFHLLCIVMIFYIGEKYFGKCVGAIAGILFAFSFKNFVYINLLQYEILLGFLLTSYVFFQIKFTFTQPKYARYIILIFHGIISFLICLIQPHFIFIVPLGIMSIYLKYREHIKPIKKVSCREFIMCSFVSTITFLLLFGSWSIYQSLLNHELIIGSKGLLWRFNVGNNLNAQGFAFPYPDIINPAGIKFIISYPFRFLWLVKERFLYLWDLKQDVWYLGHPLIDKLKLLLGNNFPELTFFLFGCIIFIAGYVRKLSIDIKQKIFHISSTFYLTFLSGILVPLVVFSSSRFLIPLLPIVVLFQGYFIVSEFQRFRHNDQGS